MAKAKATTTDRTASWDRQPMAFSMRGSEPWKRAVAELAAACHWSIPTLVEVAIEELAERRGLPKLPDRTKKPEPEPEPKAKATGAKGATRTRTRATRAKEKATA